MRCSAILLIGITALAWDAGFQRIQDRQSNWTIGQTVQTSSGPVSGHSASNDSKVSEYLGIPFGQAPIGDLRFAAPVRFNGTAPLDGSDFGFSCPEAIPSKAIPNTADLAAANLTSVWTPVIELLSNTNAKHNEDCLYLNVWTKPQTGEAKKAVLLWIYGGGFISGSSSVPGYNGANIAEQEEVVVVSINYRLSIFGFPGNPAGTNNLGLLDQRLAVEWVRDNIANFGGDPTRITLVGQSAGSASVDFYSYAWDSDPIAAGFIAESGTVFSWGLPNSRASAAAAWFNVSSTLGCGNASSDSATVLSCMRTKNYSAILNAVPKAGGPAGILGFFVPTIDDTVVFSNYLARTPAKVPLIVGNNNYEAGLFRTHFALDGIFFSNVFWDVFNLQEFTCPAGIRANASVVAGNPTWRYRYFGVWPNLAISSEAGTWHEAEVPLLFDTIPESPGSTQQEVQFANYMRGAWAAFAKDPVNGLNNYEGGWPQYDVSEETLIRLAYNNLIGTNAVSPYLYDADCIPVNISSTNTSIPDTIPNLGSTLMATSIATSTKVIGAGAATGSALASTTTKSSESKLSVSNFVYFATFFAAYFIM